MTDTPVARPRERDTSLRHVERDAAIVCAIMSGLALVLQRGASSGALGVIGGGALMAVSFRAITGAVDAVVTRATSSPDAADAPSHARVGFAVLGFVLRYIAIGLVAWALLVKLHAHPIGLFAGVTAPVIAIGIEAARLQRAVRTSPPSPPGAGPASGS
jgi:hypothetical protein